MKTIANLITIATMSLLTSLSYAGSDQENQCISKLKPQPGPVCYTLELSDCNLKDKDIPALVKFIKSDRYVSGLNIRKNQISDEGAKEMAALYALEELDISENKISDKGISSIAANLQRLTELAASKNKITSKGALALANSRFDRLDLSDNLIGDAGAIALANMTDLNLSHNPFSPKATLALANSQTLKSLEIAYATLDEASINAFAKNTSITWLDISHTHLKDEDAALLTQNSTLLAFIAEGNELTDAALSPNMNNLVYLVLDDNHIGAEGVKNLSKYKNLKSLSLNNNFIGDEGIAYLSQSSTLINLWADNNQITDKGAKSLASMASTEFTQAYLANNTIGPDGAIAIATMPLGYLDMSNNPISDAGSSKLAESTTLIVLTLSNANIHDPGAFALAKTNTLWNLNVSNNHIAADGIQALKANSSIHYLNVDGNIPGSTLNEKKQIERNEMKKKLYRFLIKQKLNGVQMKFPLFEHS